MFELWGMEFGTPAWLLLAPVVFFVPWLSRQPRLAWSSFALSLAQPTLRQRLAWLPELLLSLALVALVVALARPQHVDRERVVEREGIDILMVLDTSGSMEEEDYTIGRRRVSRIAAAKQVIAEFIEGRPDDRIGLVVFGDVAFTQVPLTTDHRAMNAFLSLVDIGTAGKSTALGDAIAVACKHMKELVAPSKVVILVTDGRKTAGLDPLDAAAAASALGIKVYTIGMGAAGGRSGPFGMMSRGSDLDEPTLKEIARLTDAAYFRADDTKSLVEVYAKIDELEKSTAEVSEFVHRDERYHGPLWLGMVLLVLHQLLAQTWLRRLP